MLETINCKLMEEGFRPFFWLAADRNPLTEPEDDRQPSNQALHGLWSAVPPASGENRSWLSLPSIPLPEN